MSSFKSRVKLSQSLMSDSIKSSPFLQLLDKTRGNIADLINLRLGQILTIVDASIQDATQRKALKDIIKNQFYSEEYWSKSIEEDFRGFKDKYLKDMDMEEFEANYWKEIRERLPKVGKSLV